MHLSKYYEYLVREHNKKVYEDSDWLCKAWEDFAEGSHMIWNVLIWKLYVLLRIQLGTLENI